MTQKGESFEGFLTEFKASLSQPSGEAVMRRINAERLLRLLADEFVEAHQAERIRVLPDNRVAGEPGADFLLQVDDYDIRLQFLDTPEGVPSLDEDRLSEFLSLLEDNPSTAALILVWTTDDLLAIPLSVARARFLLEHPDHLSALLKRAQPLPEVLRTIVAQQVKVWEVGLDEIAPSPAKGGDMRRMFEEAIAKAIEAERGRSYRSVERKAAARRFPADEEKRLILSVLGEALNGAEARDLVPQLTHISRRGTL
jgi:hypothetical protein